MNMNTNTIKKPGRGRPLKIKTGDFMRVVVGPLAGAEGSVTNVTEKTAKKGNRKVIFVEIRQLNGNPIRLPRHHFEFAATRPKEFFE